MAYPKVDPAEVTAGFVAFDDEGVAVPAMLAAGDWNGAALVEVVANRAEFPCTLDTIGGEG